MVHTALILLSFFPLADAGYTGFPGAQARDHNRGRDERVLFAVVGHLSSEAQSEQIRTKGWKNTQKNANMGGQDSGQWSSSSTTTPGTTSVSTAPPKIVSTELIATTTYPTITSTASVPAHPSWSNLPSSASISSPWSLATSFLAPSSLSPPSGFNSYPVPLAESAFSTSTPTKSTTTRSMTVLVTSSRQASTPTSSSPALDLSIPPSPGPKGLSASEKASIGIGVTVGILSVAGLIIFFLWRRRRQQRQYAVKGADDNIPGTPTSLSRSPPHTISIFSPFLRTHFTSLIAKITPAKPALSAASPEEPPAEEKDTEFSILSAEKVQIAHKGQGSVRSIRTRCSSSSLLSTASIRSQARANNTDSSPNIPSPSGLAVAMAGIDKAQDGLLHPESASTKMVEMRNRLNIALTSNPISPIMKEVKEEESSSGRSYEGESWPLFE